ncbi:transcriptional regulator [Spirochaetia bacterium]|nr:transcriptional regulator [Spirochaetia bacterium]
MGFRENLKEELAYSGLLVKELSAQSGVNKRTIDSYLMDGGSVPSVDAAVKIAAALGVSVEYLVTGSENRRKMTLASLSPGLRSLIQAVEGLSEGSQKVVLKSALYLTEELKKQEETLH